MKIKEFLKLHEEGEGGAAPAGGNPTGSAPNTSDSVLGSSVRIPQRYPFGKKKKLKKMISFVGDKK